MRGASALDVFTRRGVVATRPRTHTMAASKTELRSRAKGKADPKGDGKSKGITCAARGRGRHCKLTAGNIIARRWCVLLARAQIGSWPPATAVQDVALPPASRAIVNGCTSSSSTESRTTRHLSFEAAERRRRLRRHRRLPPCGVDLRWGSTWQGSALSHFMLRVRMMARTAPSRGTPQRRDSCR